MTIGDLMMFLVYLLMLLEPLATLAQSATQFQNSLSGLDRVLDLLEEPREMPSTPGAQMLSSTSRLPTPAATLRRFTTSNSRSRPAKRSRSSAPAAPAKPRSLIW